ncbi:MAG: ABC transporter ATP-binding protein [Chloroflexi bacterium]|nr:ABC transporter ATP-binding protein [Chloroflexota bacterium]
MPKTVISVENVSKSYQLGVINTGTFRGDLKRWWARQRGKPDPFQKIGETDHGNRQGETLWALKDINFQVQQGEALGIIGRNGAGKSTLLKILSRVTAPTSGTVKVKGRIASLLEVGTGFHPELTGRENVFLNGAIMGMSRVEVARKFDEIVDFSGVEKFIDTPVKRYSSGMYVRLAFAVAAHLEPEILIVDEVLAVGDIEFQQKCLGKMGNVANEGRTVLFVSHNMAAVQQLCSKGLVLSSGQLLFSGSIRDSIEEYINVSKRSIDYGKDGFVDLENVREKIYQGKIFKRIRVLDKNNNPCQTFPMLNPIKIEVELENTEHYPGMDYGISIFNATGQRITSFATWMMKEKKQTPKKVRLEIPRINFSAGNFIIGLSMTHPKEGIYIDKIDNAIGFHVEAIDIFNTGRVFDSDYGLIVPDGNFLLF